MIAKGPKPPFANLKPAVLVLALVGLLLVSGFITSKTLFPATSTDNPGRTNVNASAGEAAVNAASVDPGSKGNTGDPAPQPRGSVTSSGNPDVTVWVNTASGVYHCPNTRWYGKTKSGKYMTQREAQAKGYRPAYGSVCG